LAAKPDNSLNLGFILGKVLLHATSIPQMTILAAQTRHDTKAIAESHLNDQLVILFIIYNFV
jgi:hypothetical protein